ncbi:MAG: glycosyltransferase family 39 protein [Rhodocyclaceae bacterium]|nr:glycosyltransferase family 39 protein [Rhodocyclaceae bacterium]
MAFSLQPDTPPPGPTPALVLALICAFLLAGIVGHDPWKSEDAINIAIAHGFAQAGHWSAPMLAGEPWFEAEPLYHWLAAMVGTVLGSILPFHEGARMAAALLGGLFFVGLAAAARRMFGREAGWAAPLLAIGTLGLLVPMHEAQPTTTILATITAVYWGAARLAEHPKTAGLLMGAGLGATFLAGGLIAVLPTLTLLAIPLWRRHWLATTAAVGLGTAIALAWPVTLALAHPEHLAGWWANELATIAPRNPLSLAHVEWLGWFAWPVLLIAAWMVWRGRRRLTAPPLAVPALGAIAALCWLLAHEPRAAATPAAAAAARATGHGRLHAPATRRGQRLGLVRHDDLLAAGRPGLAGGIGAFAWLAAESGGQRRADCARICRHPLDAGAAGGGGDHAGMVGGACRATALAMAPRASLGRGSDRFVAFRRVSADAMDRPWQDLSPGRRQP